MINSSYTPSRNPTLILKVLWLVTIGLFSSCKCTLDGYTCEKEDSSSIRLEQEWYVFKNEEMGRLSASQYDSVLTITAFVSRKGATTNSNVNIGFGFFLNMELVRMANQDSFSFRSGTVEFVKNNVYGDIYQISGTSIQLQDYDCCECQQTQQINPAQGPEKLIMNVNGILDNGTKQKELELKIRFSTRKVGFGSC